MSHPVSLCRKVSLDYKVTATLAPRLTAFVSFGKFAVSLTVAQVAETGNLTVLLLDSSNLRHNTV